MMNKIQLPGIILLLTLASHTLATELKPYTGSMQPVDFTLSDIKGNIHTLSQYRGKLVLINFWASWCPPCIEELPSLQRLQKLYDNRPLKILAIDVGEPAELVMPYLEEIKVTNLTVLMDAGGESHKDWNIYVFPTNFLLDQSGNIRYANVGALNWDDESVVQIIDKLLE